MISCHPVNSTRTLPAEDVSKRAAADPRLGKYRAAVQAAAETAFQEPGAIVEKLTRQAIEKPGTMAEIRRQLYETPQELGALRGGLSRYLRREDEERQAARSAAQWVALGLTDFAGAAQSIKAEIIGEWASFVQREQIAIPEPSEKLQVVLAEGQMTQAVIAEVARNNDLMREINDGVDAPRRHRGAKVVVLTATLREASVTEVSTIGLDLAKNVFQAHGASVSGAILFRKRLRRDQVLAFFAAQPRCLVAMEACASAHYWAREIAKLGHEVRLIAPTYVKPFVKRQKNNATDAEAICEAAQRPTMRFVAVKSEAKQASAVVFRTRDLLVGQRTQIINAIRGHLAEYGLIAPQGPSHVDQLIAQIEDPSSGIPDPARSCLAVLVETLRALQGKIVALDAEIAARAKRDDGARRLMSIPGIGPLIATAIEALAPPVETFRSGRDFAAWVGLTPLQRSTGAQERLGKISRMGERTLRRLLIIGASGVVRWARRKGVPAGSWLARMLARKPPMLVMVALANKMARIAWALIAKGGSYRAPAVAA